MFSFFKSLRDKPENERRRFAIAASIFLTLAIALGWSTFSLYSSKGFHNLFGQTSATSSITSTSVFSELLGFISSTTSELKQEFSFGVSEISNLFQETSTVTSTTNR
jgi:amino acid permease